MRLFEVESGPFFRDFLIFYFSFFIQSEMSCLYDSLKHAESVVEELERDHLLIMSDLSKAFEEGLIEESYMLKRALEFKRVLQSYRDSCSEIIAWFKQNSDSEYY